MTKDQLIALFDSYSHRTDLAVELKDEFLELTRRRIGRMLRGQANATSTNVTPTQNPLALPPDLRQLRRISYGSGSTDVVLTAVGPQALNRYARTGSNTQVYHANGLMAEIRPFFSREYRVDYFREPAEFTSGTTVLPEVEAYPYLWLYGMLLELRSWEQDVALMNVARQIFADELSDIERQMWTAEMSNPASQAR